MTNTRPLYIYTDGSCINQQDINTRRAAIGVSLGVKHPDNVSEALPGEKQTSARAELAAVVRALEIAKKQPLRPLTVYTDSKYAKLELDRILRPKEHKKISGDRENGDLIKQLGQLILLRKTPVTAVKVPAHSDSVGNIHADTLANTAARAAYNAAQAQRNATVHGY